MELQLSSGVRVFAVTFWQYSDSGTFPGDQDYFNGATDRLQALALG
ncbi:GH25 family lysozyme M1 (1,4-beta-N-acetylmuramidase) [Kitasatospora sp. GP30]|nr:hypothetical protein [Kitasatospora sp. GP30]MDH6141846.1 GH25 family lysozyme M1 (1,4-beta-N-acetylmuramidase) [Kitasatospora sp. GP30]